MTERPEKVLVVDDDRLVREQGREALSRAGFQVVLAAGCAEALERARAERVDVVLLDLILADGYGTEILPFLRGIDPDVPVVILTGYGALENAIEALQQGVYDFIQKPFRAEVVLSAVRRALERRRLNLRNRSLVLQLSRKLNEMEVLQRIGEATNSTLDLDQILHAIVEAAREALRSEASSLLLVEEPTGDLAFAVALGERGAEVREVRLKRGEGIAGWVAERGEPVLVADVRADPRFYAQADAQTGFQTRSILAAPLKARGRTIGVIEAINRTGPDPYTGEDLHLLTLIAAQAAIAIQNGQLYRRVNQQLAALQELEAMKEHLTQLVIHDLQNPLTSVILFLEMVRASGATGEHLRYLEDARRCCRHLSSLIEDLMDLGRMEEGRLKLDITEFSLEEVIGETLAEMEPLALEGEKRIVFVPAGPVPKVRADRKLAYRVLANLVANAIHHSFPGGVVTVAVGEDLSAGMVRVSVADRGEGIPAASRQRIFEKFVQADSALVRYRAGRGLGLTFCKMAVEAHGGQIGVESASGLGSTFTFSLPLPPGEPHGPAGR